jgi:trk system potassium uptake protein TrkA
LADSHYPALKTIARVNGEGYANFHYYGTSASGERLLGVDNFINPDLESARFILDAVEHGAEGEVISFAGTKWKLGAVDVNDGSKFSELHIKDYHNIVPYNSLITLVERAGDSEPILPDGNTIIKAGDRIHILAEEKDIGRLFAFAGRRESMLRKIGIVGGTHITELIADALLQGAGKKELVIIEQDYVRCKELAARFPKALVLNEDISDENFVAEERLNSIDMIITATDSQELNVIVALYLKAAGVKRAAALVAGGGYANIARRLGIDVVVPTKQVVTDSIMSCLLGNDVKKVRRIGDGNMEVVEVFVSGNSLMCGKSIVKFRGETGALVLLVSRAEASFIPRGDYVFLEGDKLILLLKTDNDSIIKKYFLS